MTELCGPSRRTGLLPTTAWCQLAPDLDIEVLLKLTQDCGRKGSFDEANWDVEMTIRNNQGIAVQRRYYGLQDLQVANGQGEAHDDAHLVDATSDLG